MRTHKSLKRAGIIFGILVVVLAGAQLVRPARADLNTDPGHTIQAQLGSTDLSLVLERACGECHSYMLSTRWYTQVAPFSWLMARGAQEGRKALDFSKWTEYPPGQQREFLLASCADAKNGTMPVPAYVRFRSDAKLTPRDVETICGASR